MIDFFGIIHLEVFSLLDALEQSTKLEWKKNGFILLHQIVPFCVQKKSSKRDTVSNCRTTQ
jgi:hypothetical protein